MMICGSAMVTRVPRTNRVVSRRSTTKTELSRIRDACGTSPPGTTTSRRRTPDVVVRCSSSRTSAATVNDDADDADDDGGGRAFRGGVWSSPSIQSTYVSSASVSDSSISSARKKTDREIERENTEKTRRRLSPSVVISLLRANELQSCRMRSTKSCNHLKEKKSGVIEGCLRALLPTLNRRH